jgi:peptide/nickel transport system substrate-binding protein
MDLRRVLIPLLLCLAISACAPPPTPTGQGGSTSPQAVWQGGPSAPPSRTLVIASRNEPPTLAAKPLRFVAAPRGINVALFNATFDYSDNKGNSQPYLATALPQLNTDSWRVFPDGRMETTYTLRDNVVWHDGTPLTAGDSAFAWEVFRTPELGVSGGEPLTHIEDVLAPDDKTVVIRWKRPYPNAVALNEDFLPLPRHILEQPFQSLDSDSFTNHAYWTREFVGLGPFQLDRWEPGTFYEAVAFDRFIFGKPKIDRIQVRFMNDPNTVMANILGGEVHASVDFAVRFQQAATLRQEWESRGMKGSVVASPTLFWKTSFQFRPDVVQPRVVLDPRVRQALAHAFDKQGINEALMGGLSIVTDTVVSPKAEYYPAVDRAISKYPFDTRVMQQKLEALGFIRGPDGFYISPDGSPFTPDLRVTADPTQEAENAIIVDTFRRAGVAATSYIIPAAQQSDGQARSIYPTMASNGGSGGETDLRDFRTASITSAENRWSGRNRGAWSNPDYDRWWEAFNTTLDRSERIRQIVELERILSEQVPIIPHYFTPQVMPHVAALKGPIAREVPDAGLESFNIWQWEWQS